MALRVISLVTLGLLASCCAAARPLDSVLCYPATMSLIESIEGRHECAYDSSYGYRAVGVGYNLDDRTTQREREFSAVLANWDKVKSGEDCLNNVQINALLTADVTRVHSKAADYIPAFNDWCCNAQAVFAHITFTLGTGSIKEDFDKVIARASSRDWKATADALKDTKWCEDFHHDCKEVVSVLKKGCDAAGGELTAEHLPFGIIF